MLESYASMDKEFSYVKRAARNSPEENIKLNLFNRRIHFFSVVFHYVKKYNEKNITNSRTYHWSDTRTRTALRYSTNATLTRTNNECFKKSVDYTDQFWDYKSTVSAIS